MAAVFAQVSGDAVGAGLDGGDRGAHRIGPCACARIAQGGDVIDIDAKAQRRSFGHGRTHSKQDDPHPEELAQQASRRMRARLWPSWFETREDALLTMRVYHK